MAVVVAAAAARMKTTMILAWQPCSKQLPPPNNNNDRQPRDPFTFRKVPLWIVFSNLLHPTINHIPLLEYGNLLRSCCYSHRLVRKILWHCRIGNRPTCRWRLGSCSPLPPKMKNHHRFCRRLETYIHTYMVVVEEKKPVVEHLFFFTSVIRVYPCYRSEYCPLLFVSCTNEGRQQRS